MTSTAPDASEIDEKIKMLLFPSGDWQFRRTKEEAIAYLLEHAEQAHPRLLALAEGDSPPIQVLLVLPRFGRVESLPVLENALRKASDPMTVIAGQALALHPCAEARVVLERALGDPRNQVVGSAAEGLARRGDRASCPALRSALSHHELEVRQRVRKAMEALGCL